MRNLWPWAYRYSPPVSHGRRAPETGPFSGKKLHSCWTKPGFGRLVPKYCTWNPCNTQGRQTSRGTAGRPGNTNAGRLRVVCGNGRAAGKTVTSQGKTVTSQENTQKRIRQEGPRGESSSSWRPHAQKADGPGLCPLRRPWGGGSPDFALMFAQLGARSGIPAADVNGQAASRLFGRKSARSAHSDMGHPKFGVFASAVSALRRRTWSRRGLPKGDVSRGSPFSTAPSATPFVGIVSRPLRDPSPAKRMLCI